MKNLRDLAAATDAILKDNGLVADGTPTLISEAVDKNTFKTHPLYKKHFMGGPEQHDEEQHSYSSKDGNHRLDHYLDMKNNHVVDIQSKVGGHTDGISGRGKHKDLHTAINQAKLAHDADRGYKVAELADRVKEFNSRGL